MKLTRWFPKETLPVHVGVYQCEWGGGVGVFFNKWDGRCWHWGDMVPELAGRDDRKQKDYCDDLVRWRGVKK